MSPSKYVEYYAKYVGFTGYIYTLIKLYLPSLLLLHYILLTLQVVFGIIFAVLIISSVISFFPFFNLGGYSFNQRSIICIPPLDYVMGRIWLSLFITFSTLPILFIITMVTMTFIFARKFARSRISRHESTKESDSSDDKKKGCRLCEFLYIIIRVELPLKQLLFNCQYILSITFCW